MPKAYADDLRVKLLEAYEAGAGILSKLALQFRVSRGYAAKVHLAQRRSGSKKRPAQRRHGPLSRVGPGEREKMIEWLREQPDLAIAELKDRLRSAGVGVCASRVVQILQEMGLRRKKNAARG